MEKWYGILVLTLAGLLVLGWGTLYRGNEGTRPLATARQTEGMDVSITPVGTPSVADLVNDLEGLPFEAFLEASYRALLLRDPELVTETGLSEFLGVEDDRLTDISDAYIRETQQLESSILEILYSYDRASLTREQRLSADVYAWYLEDRVRGHAFMYNDYPVSPLIVALPNSLIHFFTEIHPVRNRQDAQDYISRLSQIQTKFDQLLEGLQLREEAGVIPSRFLVQWTRQEINQIAHGRARYLPFYTAFEEKLNTLNNLDRAAKRALLEAAEREIDASVIPAFQSLADYLGHLESVATTDEGVWKFANGKAYYAYALRHHSTTELSADEIHELGLQEVDRIRAEMRTIFNGLGYPQGENLVALFARVAQDGGSYRGREILAQYEAIIEAAKQHLGEAFGRFPGAEVVVIGVPRGGFYVPPAVDGSRPGAFYASVTGEEPRFGMPTLAYHEAIPGHHFQIALAQELDLPSFRRGVTFTAYAEGWALYAERLAWELGFYEDDPYGNLGRLQMEAFRAARLVVDTGIHAKRWTYEEAVSYLLEKTGLPRDMVEFEVARYIVWPGQAVAYKIGMLKILELRERATERLGDAFGLKEFHNVILGCGSVPLPILEQIVEEYIETQLDI
jgi:uncharacterized protein (DUF885 family)